MNIKDPAQVCLPIPDWGPEDDRRTFTGDLITAAVVSIMLIPQLLAPALLVGVPPRVRPGASIAPPMPTHSSRSPTPYRDRGALLSFSRWHPRPRDRMALTSSAHVEDREWPQTSRSPGKEIEQ
jgi:hypothetical protein